MNISDDHQRALSERGIDKMLKEVRDDNRENDAEHMKSVSIDRTHLGRQWLINDTEAMIPFVTTFISNIICTIYAPLLWTKVGFIPSTLTPSYNALHDSDPR